MFNGLELKAARVKKGYNQSKVAKHLKMTVKTYSRKENGKAPFTPNEIVVLAELLDLDLKEVNTIFFGGKLTHVLSNEQAATKETA